MTRRRLTLLAGAGPHGDALLRSPKVGIFSSSAPAGRLVDAGATVGRLTVLGRTFDLVVPDGVSGRIESVVPSAGARAVGYGEPLAHVRAALAAGATVERNDAASRPASTGIPVLAPTDGVFYRAPSAGAPPYVSEGDAVVSGQPIGLIEVMKTFNPIAYGGPGLPGDAVVVSILVEDEAEVRAGQALLLVSAR